MNNNDDTDDTNDSDSNDSHAEYSSVRDNPVSRLLQAAWEMGLYGETSIAFDKDGRIMYFAITKGTLEEAGEAQKNDTWFWEEHVPPARH
jgi:hypothetical protein|tara:strand:- start:805 stop:1074 length:270 start_codon:yes stop_codon:yes gene_type:complete